jgi:hypothetical protein
VKKELAEHNYNTLDKILLQILDRGRARSKHGGVVHYNKFIFVHAFGSVVFMYENMDIKDGLQQVQRSNYRVLFVFMSLMKSLPMVAKTEV